MYQPENWVPKQKPLQVFHVQLDNLEDIKSLLGATNIRQAYNRNRTILIEWTMQHRETFSALVGQYIVRNDRGQFEVLDPDELREDYQPYIEETKVEKVNLTHPELGRLVAVEKTDEGFTEVVFETPDGSPVVFDVRKDKEKAIDPPTAVPTYPKQNGNPNNGYPKSNNPQNNNNRPKSNNNQEKN